MTDIQAVLAESTFSGSDKRKARKEAQNLLRKALHKTEGKPGLSAEKQQERMQTARDMLNDARNLLTFAANESGVSTMAPGADKEAPEAVAEGVAVEEDPTEAATLADAESTDFDVVGAGGE